MVAGSADSPLVDVQSDVKKSLQRGRAYTGRTEELRTTKVRIVRRRSGSSILRARGKVTVAASSGCGVLHDTSLAHAFRSSTVETQVLLDARLSNGSCSHVLFNWWDRYSRGPMGLENDFRGRAMTRHRDRFLVSNRWIRVLGNVAMFRFSLETECTILPRSAVAGFFRSTVTFSRPLAATR